jgi:peptidoglycan hydrolase-like protein with peptidoglycan-binding domain
MNPWLGAYPGHLHYWGAGEVASHVTSIQYHLRYNRGYGNVQVDGIMGYFTDYAIRDRQRRNRLVQDGIIGPLTWPVL